MLEAIKLIKMLGFTGQLDRDVQRLCSAKLHVSRLFRKLIQIDCRIP